MSIYSSAFASKQPTEFVPGKYQFLVFLEGELNRQRLVKGKFRIYGAGSRRGRKIGRERFTGVSHEQDVVYGLLPSRINPGYY